MRRAAVLALPLLLIAGTSNAFAWGCDAHRTIAAIAERFLDRQTISTLESILRAAPADQGLARVCPPLSVDPIVDASTWADEYRSSGAPSTGSWHFIDFPLAIGAPTSNYEQFCRNGNCVIDAIVNQYRVLTSSADPRRKADALRFVIHLLGDVHQPLHAITNGDRGGSCFPVTLFGDAPDEDRRHNIVPNLHGAWDSGLLRRYMSDRRLRGPQALADDVMRVTPVTRVEPQAPTRELVLGWARESNALARSVAYGRLPLKPPIESARALRLTSCNDNNRVAERLAALHEQIDRNYEDAVLPALEAQLRLAAVRLAAVLKSAVLSIRQAALPRDGRGRVLRMETMRTP